MSKIYVRPKVERLCFNGDGDLVGIGMEGGETVLIASVELAEAVEEVYPTLAASFYTKMMRARERRLEWGSQSS